MSTSLFINSVVAINFPSPYMPLIYQVHQNDTVTGFGIPTDTAQSIAPMKISEDTPVLRIAKADGTFTLSADFNGGKYYVFAFWDQQPQENAPALWIGETSAHNFKLTLNLSKPGLGAFGLAKN